MVTSDLNRILDDWPLEPGILQVRKIVGRDGVHFVQLRIELGVLQMMLDGRPDGEKPGGFESALDLLQSSSGGDDLSLAEQSELVREMLQYYRRRVALMALAKQAQANDDLDEADGCYRRAIRDADHNLSILDLLHKRGAGPDVTDEHEPYRPFILMHRTICHAERALLVHDPDEAIERIKAGIAAIEACKAAPDEAFSEPTQKRNPFIHELRRFEKHIRRKYHRRRTLSEKLADAVAAEDFEQAARLRDKLAARKRQGELRIEN